MGETFVGGHTHYLTSESTHIDSADMEDMICHFTEHGYGRFGSQGGQLIILAHPNQVEDMMFWRAGVKYAPGKTPKWDFVPAQAAPVYFTTSIWSALSLQVNSRSTGARQLRGRLAH